MSNPTNPQEAPQEPQQNSTAEGLWTPDPETQDDPRGDEVEKAAHEVVKKTGAKIALLLVAWDDGDLKQATVTVPDASLIDLSQAALNSITAGVNIVRNINATAREVAKQVQLDAKADAEERDAKSDG